MKIVEGVFCKWKEDYEIEKIRGLILEIQPILAGTH